MRGYDMGNHKLYACVSLYCSAAKMQKLPSGHIGPTLHIHEPNLCRFGRFPATCTDGVRFELRELVAAVQFFLIFLK